MSAYIGSLVERYIGAYKEAYQEARDRDQYPDFAHQVADRVATQYLAERSKG